MSGADGSAPSSQPPVPSPAERWALFVDFDGTLVPIASTPARVRWRPLLGEQLGRIQQRLDGAVAIISGRPTEDIARIIAPQRFAMAGLHGMERCNPQGGVLRASTAAPALAQVRAALALMARAHPGLAIEDKGASIAVHYRLAPHLSTLVRARLTELEATLGPSWVLQSGKMVLEIRPAGGDKGTAIAEFMEEAPFRGRRPVFIGDDDTDESGFARVNALQGISVKVGGGPTCAGWRLRSVAQVGRWLHAVLRAMGDENA